MYGQYNANPLAILSFSGARNTCYFEESYIPL